MTGKLRSQGSWTPLARFADLNISPQQRHAGQDKAILAARHALYTHAKQRNPARWSGHTRDWSHIGVVTLNPERDEVVSMAAMRSTYSAASCLTQAATTLTRAEDATRIARTSACARRSADDLHDVFPAAPGGDSLDSRPPNPPSNEAKDCRNCC